MGVKLGDIVIRRQISFEDLSNKIIAIDFSNSAYQFLSSIRQQDGTPLMDSKGRITSVYMGVWTRFSNLIQQNIKSVIVFDGKMPELKHKEQQGRMERKEIAKEKFRKAESEEEMLRYAKQTSYLTKEMIEESKRLIEAMGFPLIQAPAEADAQMAYMNKNGDVFACGSSDFDCLLHGAPRLITNPTLSQRRRLPTGAYIKIFPELIELEESLKNLNINRDQLIILGILSGTDYNPSGIYGIGPKKALKLAKEYKDYDKLFKDMKAEFDWKEIFSLFKNMKVEKNYKLEWKDVDEKTIKKILVDEHNFSEERIDNTINKLNESKKAKQQKGLDSWFN